MLTMNIPQELQLLYDRLMASGCNMFYIEGVGGPQADCVEVLCKKGTNWAICYSERGQLFSPIFESDDLEDVIVFYENHILRMDHSHLVIMTRNLEKFNEHKSILEKHNIRTSQNDLPHYKFMNDKIYRLFVINKDVFKAKEIFGELPVMDEDLK